MIPQSSAFPSRRSRFCNTVQAKIDNGGFRYLFENNFNFDPPYKMSSDAYRRIGSVDAAEKLDEAVALFPFADPHLKEEARSEFMDALDEDHQLFVSTRRRGVRG